MKKEAKKPPTKGVQKNVAEFLDDNTKVDCVKAVLEACNSAQDDELIGAIVGLNKIFSRVFSGNDGFFTSSGPLQEEFNAAWDSLLTLLLRGEKNGPSDLSLQTLLKWIEVETVKVSTGDGKEYVFPEQRLEKLISFLCSSNNMDRHITKFVEQMEKFDDLNFYACKALWRVSDKFGKEPQISDQEARNYFSLLKAVRIRDKFMDDEVLPAYGGLENFPFQYKESQKFYQYAWVNFLRASLPEKLYIQVLVILNEKRVGQFKNPCLLADFLIESYNRGGAVALLALDGLFTLIHKHNLELPDFYTRFYALFRPEIFYVKYRARFFYLADVFLSSTHLPSYLVAAFCKRLSRLCLTAPAYSQLHVIPFIGNLIIRHASLARMVHGTIDANSPMDLSTDPFDETEPDPAKTRAIESSLWEVKSLQSHWFHKAGAKAHIIDNAFPKIEWDFSDLLETGYSELFDRSVKEKYKGAIPTNYHRPKGLFKHADDRMSSTWLLE